VWWFVVECAFEIGQRVPLGARIAAVTPAWFADFPVLEAIPAYFARGTFDPLDILYRPSACRQALPIRRWMPLQRSP
jgi:hypothetical protein